jgi:hypothetical protein
MVALALLLLALLVLLVKNKIKINKIRLEFSNSYLRLLCCLYVYKFDRFMQQFW